MDIRSVNNNKDSFVNRSKRADKAEKGDLGSSDSASGVNRSESADSIKDNLDLSQQKFADDIQFAKQALEQLNRESGARLREIRQKIRDNDYDSTEIHGKIGDAISEKLSYLEISTQVDDGEAGSNRISELDDQLVEKLTENDQVLTAITDRILNDLTQL